MPFDVVCVGNAIIDAFLTIHDANVNCSLNKEDCTLCVRFGEKILLDSCEFHLGGNACNVSAGTARLGLQSALVAEIAMDEFSAKILNGLRKEEVNTDYLLRNEGQSSFTIGLNFQGERTLFVEHREREHNFHLTGLETKSLYLTSLGNKWQHVYQAVASYKKTHLETLLAFNPGSVQYKDGVETFAYILPLTDILFVNREEARKLLKSEEGEMESLAKALQKLGPKIVVITDGEKGSAAIDEKSGVFHQGIVSSTLVERTGAGDAFATGFLAARLQGLEIQHALMWGATNAASVIAHIGSQRGLLTREEIERKIEV